MKRYTNEDIKKLKAKINENKDFLFYDEHGKISRTKNIKFVILREGFISGMNGNFMTTNIECVGFTGQSYKQSEVESIVQRLKQINGYYPKHHDWSTRQQM